MDNMLNKWFTAMRSKGKPITWPVIIEKVKYFYDEFKITDRCMFCEEVTKNYLLRSEISIVTI
jgi:hypothetical protein